MERKADFQMSLGLIIGIVFAIVLLSLSLTWLRGMFENILGITDDLTQKAQSTLSDAFRTGTTSFAVWPTQYTLPAGKGLKMSAGIENTATDGRKHDFVINIIPASADPTVIAARGCSDFKTCSLLRAEMIKWLTYDATAGGIGIGAVGFKFIEIRPSTDAIKGTYIFNVVACYDKTGGTPASESCQQTSPNLWGGSAQQIIITVR